MYLPWGDVSSYNIFREGCVCTFELRGYDEVAWSLGNLRDCATEETHCRAMCLYGFGSNHE